MKFLKLTSINFKYILNKQTLIFIFTSLFVIGVALLFNANIFSGKASKIMYMQEYYYGYLNSSYNVVVVIFVFFSIFISLNFSNNYDTYLITRRPRYEIIMAKLLSCFLVILFYMYLTFCLFIIVPCFSLKYFSINNKIIISFIRIFLNGFFYMLVSSLLVEICQNYLSCFIALVVFWIMKILTTVSVKKNSIIFYLNHLFPSIIIDETKTIAKCLNNAITPFLCVLLIYVIAIVYIKKSFK